MLKRVMVQNWRAFNAAEVTLRPGLNVLVGPNGAGKTSLLEAVAYALAGQPSTLPDVRLLARADGRPVDVALAFELDGTEWEVCRGLGPTHRRGGEVLRKAGVAVAEGSEPVTAALERLLGVPADFFLRVLYMPEGDVYRFLASPPLAAIDAHLRRVLGLEQLALVDQAAARVKRDLAHEHGQLTSLAEQVAGHDRVLTEGRARWSSDPAARRQAIEAERGRVAAARRAAQDERRQLDDAAHQLTRTLAEVASLEPERATLAATAAPADAVPALRERCAELEVAIQKLDGDLAQREAERRPLAARRQQLAGRLALDLLADDADGRARRAEGEAAIRRVEDGLAATAAEREALAESTAFLAAHAPGATSEAVCPVCRQPLPEALRQRILAENAARDAELAERQEELRRERQATATALEAAGEELRGRLLAEHAAQEQTLTERLAALRTQRQGQAEELQAVESRLGEATNRRRRLDELTSRLVDLLAGDRSVESLRAEQGELAARQEAAREREEALAEQDDSLREELAALQGYLQVAAMAGRGPAALARTRVALARRELLAELFAAATAQTLVQLREGALAEAYAEVARAWEQLIGWAEVRVEPQAKGRLAVHRVGRSLELAQLSGGERAAFLVLLHAHLGRHFGRGGFLLLDEPLEHLDATNGRRLLQHLVRACTDGTLAQVVLATVEADVVRAAIGDGQAHVVALPLGGTAGS